LNRLSQEYLSRISNLQQRMNIDGIDGFLITQNVDLYYLTGSMQTGYLFVPSEGTPIYYVRRSLERAMEESAVSVETLGSFREFGSRLIQDFSQVFRKEHPVLAMEYDVAPVQLYHRISNLLPHVEWVDGSSSIRMVRMVKSAYEIAKIKEAAKLVQEALDHAIHYIYEGMPEYELIARIEFDLRMKGHSGLLRMRAYNQEIITGVVGAGEAIAKPTYFDGPGGGIGLSAANPQGAGRRPIQRNEPILVDIGCCIDGYVTDQTRTLVIGELPDDLMNAYLCSEQILRLTEQQLKPGVSCETLYVSSLEAASRNQLLDHYMGFGADQVKFLGHGIGLEVDEWPILAKGFHTPLEEGMVIAIEPKFTFPGRGVVGIENTYLVTGDGFDRLTLSQEGIIRIK
jgi:Xaa-Pro dipeptidase